MQWLVRMGFQVPVKAPWIWFSFHLKLRKPNPGALEPRTRHPFISLSRLPTLAHRPGFLLEACGEERAEDMKVMTVNHGFSLRLCDNSQNLFPVGCCHRADGENRLTCPTAVAHGFPDPSDFISFNLK